MDDETFRDLVCSWLVALVSFSIDLDACVWMHILTLCNLWPHHGSPGGNTEILSGRSLCQILWWAGNATKEGDFIAG